jgi:glycosyltransferase involved in cell wall biosynthesis
MTVVSVIIPLYNHEAYINACIESVAAQTYSDLELIIVDDHSTDGSFDIARMTLSGMQERFARIKLVRNSRNRGAAFALNRGIAAAKGQILAFLNSDDLYTPERLATVLSAMLQENRSWGFSRVDPIGPDGSPFWAAHEAHQFSIEPAQLQHAYPAPSWSLLQLQASISTGNIVVTRDLALAVGGFLPFICRYDWAFVLACAWHDEFVFIDEPLYKYRFHSTNSFSDLSHLVSNDAGTVLRNHHIRASTAPGPNPTYPSPQFDSALYKKIAAQLDLDGICAAEYAPYKKGYRTVDLYKI